MSTIKAWARLYSKRTVPPPLVPLHSRRVVTNFRCRISTENRFSTAIRSSSVENRRLSCSDAQIFSQTLSNVRVYQVNPVVWSGLAVNTIISDACEKSSTHTHTLSLPLQAGLSCKEVQRKMENTTTSHWIICFLTFFFLLVRPCWRWRRRRHWRGLISCCWHPCDTQPSGGEVRLTKHSQVQGGF